MSQPFETLLRASAIALLLAAAATAQPARALDPTCKTVIDAMMKQIGTPTHVVATETAAFRADGKSRTNEMIYAGDAIYIQVQGKWVRSTMSIREMRQQQEENQRNSKSLSCRYLRDEAVNGETAAVYYSETNEPDTGKSKATLWVSKRTGLPLKSESYIDADAKDAMHMVIRYDYAGVKPPAGVK
jgi:hypothetical protein